MDRTPPRPAFRSDRLYAAAAEAGKTQQQIAIDLGMSIRSVQGWFLGERGPNGSALVALAELLDRRPEWFFEADREAA